MFTDFIHRLIVFLFEIFFLNLIINPFFPVVCSIPFAFTNFLFLGHVFWKHRHFDVFNRPWIYYEPLVKKAFVFFISENLFLSDAPRYPKLKSYVSIKYATQLVRKQYLFCEIIILCNTLLYFSKNLQTATVYIWCPVSLVDNIVTVYYSYKTGFS